MLRSRSQGTIRYISRAGDAQLTLTRELNNLNYDETRKEAYLINVTMRLYGE